MIAQGKQYHPSTVLEVTSLSGGLFWLSCLWSGPAPKAGQFFMIKPRRSTVFLPRPISAALWKQEPTAGTRTEIRLSFLVLRRGRGTEELSALHPGDCIELSGPLGNSWEDFIGSPEPGETPVLPDTVALVGGGVGIAPLLSLPARHPGAFDFYAGFKNAFTSRVEQNVLLGPIEQNARKLIIAVENENAVPESPGFTGTFHRGRITGFLDPKAYRAVCACGPEAMLRVVAEQCRTAGVPCYVSLERRMACGVGACLGCTVETANGNRRCCTDGPVFNAEDVFE